MIYKPLQGRDDGIYWYVLQTHSAAEIGFNRYWDLHRKSRVNSHGDLVRDWGLLKHKPNESEKFFDLINGAKLFMKSGQNFEDLRAETLDGTIIDEYRQQHAYLWPTVIRPMLARRKGWADIYSTPNGFEHFYDLVQAALTDPEWTFFSAPSSEAWWWTPEEIASAKANMTEAEFAQEILAEFREFGVGKAYLNHGPHNQMLQNPFAVRGYDWSPYLPITVGIDFNVAIMAWQLLQVRNQQFYFGDEIAMTNTHTQQMTELLIERVKDHKPGVEIIGDASGKANKTSASGETDYSIIMQMLKAAGIPARNLTPESNPPVKDRINTVNGRLKAADGGIHLWYHPLRCKNLKRDFERVTWKAGATGAILDKSNPLLTHSSDGAGYPICHHTAQFKVAPGKMRVLMR